MDLPPLRLWSTGWTSRTAGFNPCCGGSASSAAMQRGRESRDGSVSILVVVDLPPLPDRPEPPGRGRWVSILVVVDLPPLLGFRSHDRGDFQVSILVVVDLPPLRCPRPPPRRPRQGFNPCCGGSASSAGARHVGCSRQHGFQSLLWWICLLCLAVRSRRWFP